jgi:hypothetical protein
VGQQDCGSDGRELLQHLIQPVFTRRYAINASNVQRRLSLVHRHYVVAYVDNVAFRQYVANGCRSDQVIVVAEHRNTAVFRPQFVQRDDHLLRQSVNLVREEIAYNCD